MVYKLEFKWTLYNFKYYEIHDTKIDYYVCYINCGFVQKLDWCTTHIRVYSNKWDGIHNWKWAEKVGVFDKDKDFFIIQ